MNINEAIRLARKKDPNLTPLMCMETKNWFKISMGNKSGEAIGNGCTYAVDKKTGECGWKSMFADEDFFNDQLVRIYENEEIKKVIRNL